jgi:hypothetical protein
MKLYWANGYPGVRFLAVFDLPRSGNASSANPLVSRKTRRGNDHEKNFVIALAAGALFGLDTVAMAQTPAVGDAPTATVGQDAATARHREVNRERGMTTGNVDGHGRPDQSRHEKRPNAP